MALIAAHLNAGVILVVTVYIIIIFLFPLFPQLHSPVPMASVDAKHQEKSTVGWFVKLVRSLYELRCVTGVILT